MATVRILSWKGIPAQVKARQPGSRPVSVALPEWFGQEIDRVAMLEGLIQTDAYLSAWEWSDEIERAGDAAEVARSVAEELATAWEHPLAEPGKSGDRPADG
jgi:cvfA/B/C family virulence factor